MWYTTVVALATLVGVASAGAYQMDIVKIQSKRMKMMTEGRWPEYLQYEQRLRARSGKASSSQPLSDYYNHVYVGNLTLGTPQQQFLVALDTSSSNLWVADSTCTDTCRNEHKYDRTKSSTFKDDGTSWSIQYGSPLDGGALSAEGIQAYETVCLGGAGTSQLCIPNTNFGRATSERTSQLDGIDGVLGLAFLSISVNGVTPPLINAINQQLLDKPLFTVWLTKNGMAEGSREGVFTYGAIDVTHCATNIAYVPLSSASYWQFRISGVTAGSYSSNAVAEVISATGNMYIGGPRSNTDGIARQFNANYNPNYGLYLVRCDIGNAPDVVFTIGGNQYAIQKKNFIVELGPNFCILALYPFESSGFGPTWILGDPFIRTYCNIYDIGQRRIGFAQAKHN